MPDLSFYIKGGIIMFMLSLVAMVATYIVFFPVIAVMNALNISAGGGLYGWSLLAIIELFVGSVILFWLVLKFKKEMGISK